MRARLGIKRVGPVDVPLPSYQTTGAAGLDLCAALSEPLLHVCLFERWGRSHTLRFGFALLMGRLPTAGGYRVVTGREVRLSVLSDAGELRRQPVQIDGDDALTLPVSISIMPGAIRMLQPA